MLKINRKSQLSGRKPRLLSRGSAFTFYFTPQSTARTYFSNEDKFEKIAEKFKKLVVISFIMTGKLAKHELREVCSGDKPFPVLWKKTEKERVGIYYSGEVTSGVFKESGNENNKNAKKLLIDFMKGANEHKGFKVEKDDITVPKASQSSSKPELSKDGEIKALENEIADIEYWLKEFNLNIKTKSIIKNKRKKDQRLNDAKKELEVLKNPSTSSSLEPSPQPVMSEEKRELNRQRGEKFGEARKLNSFLVSQGPSSQEKKEAREKIKIVNKEIEILNKKVELLSASSEQDLDRLNKEIKGLEDELQKLKDQASSPSQRRTARVSDQKPKPKPKPKQKQKEIALSKKRKVLAVYDYRTKVVPIHYRKAFENEFKGVANITWFEKSMTVSEKSYEFLFYFSENFSPRVMLRAPDVFNEMKGKAKNFVFIRLQNSLYDGSSKIDTYVEEGEDGSSNTTHQIEGGDLGVRFSFNSVSEKFRNDNKTKASITLLKEHLAKNQETTTKGAQKQNPLSKKVGDLVEKLDQLKKKLGNLGKVLGLVKGQLKP